MTPTKRCPRCGVDKPREAFVRNRSSKDGLGNYCRPCHAEVVRANVKKNHGGGRQFQLKRRYKTDPVVLEWMSLQQEGLCAVCGEPSGRHVDHDHTTGEVRGIVCFNCNRGLGYFGDDLRMFYLAADYLEQA